MLWNWNVSVIAPCLFILFIPFSSWLKARRGATFRAGIGSCVSLSHSILLIPPISLNKRQNLNFKILSEKRIWPWQLHINPANERQNTKTWLTFCSSSWCEFAGVPEVGYCNLTGKLGFPFLHLAAAKTFLCTLSNSPFLLILRNKNHFNE